MICGCADVFGALKRLALPPELLAAGPKRLRVLIFNTTGHVIHHVRSLVCRCVARAGAWRNWRELQRLLSGAALNPLQRLTSQSQLLKTGTLGVLQLPLSA